MNTLRKNVSGFLFKHKPAQFAILTIAKLASLGTRLAPWGLPLTIGGKYTMPIQYMYIHFYT